MTAKLKTKLPGKKYKVQASSFGLLDFIRKQGVIGLAVGFILGGAVSELVSSLVQDIINPILGIALGKAENLSELSIVIGEAEIRWGNFLKVSIDFIVIAFVVYFAVKLLKLDKENEEKN